jgi:(E)-4-hydroxy-3-methylbut-2-enyl-diphosphate synthase
MGMVESAMEFLRIARYENYHNIVLSMKSSNPQVMVQAYRLLVKMMQEELGECYPLHLGVTEAGDGEDGRIKSAVGIGTLLEEGLGDTIRVSLTEDPELEIPVCRDMVKRYSQQQSNSSDENDAANEQNATDIKTTNSKLPYSPFEYKRRKTFLVNDIGGHHVPAVIADLSKVEAITPTTLQSIGYSYDAALDKWNIADTAADYVFTGNRVLPFSLPGTLKVIVAVNTWQQAVDKTKYFPIYSDDEYLTATTKSDVLNFVMVDCFNNESDAAGNNQLKNLEKLGSDKTVVLCLSSQHKFPLLAVRKMFVTLLEKDLKNPVVLIVDSNWKTADEHLIHYATEAGALLLDGFGDGVCFGMTAESYQQSTANFQRSTVSSSGRNYLQSQTAEQFINNTAFSILQATRTRISKTEYISCPSCGRTLFDLQETTARIRSRTAHLKGLKIAIMGCIVNGPGEMADADFGYVGSGPGKITLYRGKEVMKRNVASEVAVEELIALLKENEAWVEP